MKFKNIILILSAVLLVLAAFFFFRSRAHKQELNSLDQRLTQVSDSLLYYKHKSIGDSLLLADNYEAALEHYRLADNIFPGQNLMEKQIDLALAEKSQNDRLVRLKDRLREIQHTQLTREQSLGEELSYKDSLMRLSNTKVNILQLETEQLRDSLIMAYEKMENIAESVGEVEFETPEGVKVFYAGDLKNKKAHGYGYGLFETGGIYAGEWKENERHGEGKYIWSDGNIYVGEYENNKRQGMGTYYFSSGEKYVGEWQNNERSGQGTMYSEEGEVILSGKWENDEVKEVVESEG